MSTATGEEPAAADRRAGRLTLFRAVFRKHIVLLVRYPVNTIAQLVSVYGFFAILYFGGRAAVSGISEGPVQVGGTVDALIVGWFLWTMAITTYFGLTMSMTEEAQWGTLEQLYMSPYGFGTVLAAMTLALLLTAFLWGAVILPALLVTTGRVLSVDLLTVGPLVAFTLLSVVGIGFVFAGLALLYKRIENLTQLMQFALIGLIAAPVAEEPLLRVLPLAQGSAMLQSAMRNGVGLGAFPVTDLVLLVGTGVGYCLAGYLVFRYCTTVARRRGVLGHY